MPFCPALSADWCIFTVGPFCTSLALTGQWGSRRCAPHPYRGATRQPGSRAHGTSVDLNISLTLGDGSLNESMPAAPATMFIPPRGGICQRGMIKGIGTDYGLDA